MGGRRREEGRWEPGFFCFRPVQIFDIAAGGRLPSAKGKKFLQISSNLWARAVKKSSIWGIQKPGFFVVLRGFKTAVFFALRAIFEFLVFPVFGFRFCRVPFL